MSKTPGTVSGPHSPHPDSRAKRGEFGRLLPWLLVIALVVVGGSGLWLWKARAPDATAGAAAQTSAQPGGSSDQRRFGSAKGTQPISVQAARRQDIRVTVDAIGSIAASNTAIVRAQVSGVLQSLNFKEGQQVQAGQVLAQIDPRAFEASLGQAEGALARDMAKLEGARVDLVRYT